MRQLIRHLLFALCLLAVMPAFAQITTLQNKKEFFNGTEDHIYDYFDREAGRLDRLEGVWTFTKLDYDEYGNLVTSEPSGKSAIIRTSGERHRAFIEVNLDRVMCAKLRVIYNIQTGGGSNYYPTEAIGCIVPQGRYTFNPQEYTISREAISFAGGKAYLVGVRIYPQGHSTANTNDSGGGGGYQPPTPEQEVRPAPGMIAPRKDRAITDPDGWEPFIDWGRQLFPSYIVSVSGSDKSAFKTEVPEDYLGDILGVIGIAINSPRNGATLRIEIDSTRYFGRVSQEFKLPKKGVRYTVFPVIPWDYESLYCINAPFTYTIRYRVTINEKTTEKVVNDATMRAIDDCPLKAFDYRGELIDLRAILAGYVNEGSGELLDKVKSEILKQGTVNSFIGYQGGRDMVIQQVYAFWKYLRSKEVRYSNATDNGYGDHPEVFSQRVRLLEDVMSSNQANCIDGTAALASMLLSVGIDPFIVIIPGHAFLGYFTDEAHTPTGVLFLETTLIGERAMSCTPPSADYLNTVTSAVQAVERSAEEVNSFVGATCVAANEVVKNQADATMVDIRAGRKLVKPIRRCQNGFSGIQPTQPPKEKDFLSKKTITATTKSGAGKSPSGSTIPGSGLVPAAAPAGKGSESLGNKSKTGQPPAIVAPAGTTSGKSANTTSPPTAAYEDPALKPATHTASETYDGGNFSSNAPAHSGTYYRVQLQSVSAYDPQKPAYMSLRNEGHRLDLEYAPAKKMYRIVVGEFATEDLALPLAWRAQQLGFGNVSIVVYTDGNRGVSKYRDWSKLYKSKD